MNEWEVTDLVTEEPPHSHRVGGVFFRVELKEVRRTSLGRLSPLSQSLCLVLAPQVRGEWCGGSPQWEEEVPLADPPRGRGGGGGEVTLAQQGVGLQPQSTGHMRSFWGACLKIRKLKSWPEV